VDLLLSCSDILGELEQPGVTPNNSALIKLLKNPWLFLIRRDADIVLARVLLRTTYCITQLHGLLAQCGPEQMRCTTSADAAAAQLRKQIITFKPKSGCSCSYCEEFFQQLLNLEGLLDHLDPKISLSACAISSRKGDDSVHIKVERVFSQLSPKSHCASRITVAAVRTKFLHISPDFFWLTGSCEKCRFLKSHHSSGVFYQCY
jgi:hypothetical protein